jgi:hypothetical protein
MVFFYIKHKWKAHPLDQFLPLAVEVFGCLHKHANVFYTIVPMPFEVWNDHRAFLFCLGYFLWMKNFNHIVKAISIFHLKLGSNHRLNYFSTFTLSEHISHLHNQLITSTRFLIWKNMASQLQAIHFYMNKFLHLVWANLVTCRFFFFVFPFFLSICMFS